MWQFFPTNVELLRSIAFFLLGLSVVFIVVYAINKLLDRYFARAAGIKPKALERRFARVIEIEPTFLTALTFLRRLVIAAVALLGVMAVVFTVFPETQGLAASILMAAGFISIVLGLAAQSSISHVISGVMISLSQPFRIGDIVEFRGDLCQVEDMRLSYTVLRTWDNRRLLVPNTILQNEVITNYSAEDPSMVVAVDVQVSYESDLEKALRIMEEIAKRHPKCAPTDHPFGQLPRAVVMEFQDSGVLLRLLSRARDQVTAWKMARDLLLEIKKEFDRNGVEIPYPRRYLVAGKELQRQLIEMVEAIKTA